MSRVQIIGILNVTPDSFHDGGWFEAPELALRRVQTMLDAGADIIEIGGESTGPNSSAVTAEEELARVIPVLDVIRKHFPAVPLAVDTYKSAVAAVALQREVTMINDVTAGRGDARMFDVVARSDAKLVMMYAKDPSPRTTIDAKRYDDVTMTITKFLTERKTAAVSAGVAEDKIILDPGLGHFVSSDPQYSFQILAKLDVFQALGCPLLLSPSRKSFLAGSETLPSADRLPGTIAASAIAVFNGASYIRTHDVLEVRRACEIAASIRVP